MPKSNIQKLENIRKKGLKGKKKSLFFNFILTIYLDETKLRKQMMQNILLLTNFNNI